MRSRIQFYLEKKMHSEKVPTKRVSKKIRRIPPSLNKKKLMINSET